MENNICQLVAVRLSWSSATGLFRTHEHAEERCGLLCSQLRDQRATLPLARACRRLPIWDLAACERGPHRPEAGNCEQEIGDPGGRREHWRLRQHILDLDALPRTDA